MGAETILGGVMAIALVLYVLFGGADFGGGVWDLFAFGPRKTEQRKLIEQAIGPIWEANHVWLILVAVLLFAGFPAAFSALTIALHIPITLFLIGVVFRGSAFTFRAYDSREDRVQKRWGLMFSVASLLAPVLLGMCVGAIASGRIRVSDRVVQSGFFGPWLHPFSWGVGLFALCLFAFLAATYLANEAKTEALADDFRRGALVTGALTGVMAAVCFGLSHVYAPIIEHGLTDRPFTWPLHLATGACASAAMWLLYKRRLRWARFAAAGQAAFIVLGWIASQLPYLVVPDVTVESAKGHPTTLRWLLIALAAGSVVLFPSLYLLFRVFRAERRA